MSAMKAVVVGANGQLGCDLMTALAARGHEAVPANHDVLDVADAEAVAAYVADAKPDLIVNTAAFHNVEGCEQDPTRSFAVNAEGPRNLALAAQAHGAALMHVSTDYVFDGAKGSPYLETDLPRPLNVYGNSKLAGEHFVSTCCDKHFNVRVSAIYGKNPCRAKGGLNFIGLMLKLARERGEVAVVDDEFVSPTYTKHAAVQMVGLAETSHYGLYHCTSQGETSWHDFAAAIFEITNTTVTLNRAKPGQFPIKVPRPLYSVLENKALQTLNLDTMPHWKDALAQYVQDNASGLGL